MTRCHATLAYRPTTSQASSRRTSRLTTETVEGAALALEGVDDVERRDGLALGVLGVGDGITDDALEERLENAAGLLVDHCSRDGVRHQNARTKRSESGEHTGRDTLDTATTRQTADGGLGDALDVVAQNLAVALGTALAEALAALAAWREDASAWFGLDRHERFSWNGLVW